MSVRVIEGIDELTTLVGQEIGVSEPVTITQELINRFADVTGDHQWIHVDVERSKNESPFGSTIGHGFLTLSLLPHLAEETFAVRGDFKMGVNYGLNRLRFPTPVLAGSQVKARFTLQSVEAVTGGFQIVLAVVVEAENASKPALVAEWVARYFV